MSENRVTIDPQFQPSKRRRNGEDDWRRRWTSIAAMVVALLVLGWVLRSPLPGTPESAGPIAPPVTSLSDAAVASPVLRPDVSGAPLGEVVPGFVDTITTMIWGNRGVDILRWPASQPVPEIMMSLDHDGGWNRSVDASGRWLVEIGRYSTLTVYAVDNDDEQSPRRAQFADVGWSAVWHDKRPGRLAWLGCLAGAYGPQSGVFTVDVDDGVEPGALPLVAYPCEDAAVWLAAWGDWGMLLQVAEDSGTTHVLLDLDGTEITRGRLGPEGEWFVGPGSADTTIWTEGVRKKDASSFVLTRDGRERSPVPGLVPGQRLESALASPDGSLLALLLDLAANYGSLVRVVEADTGSVVAEIAEPSWWVARMVWSTDGRYLVYERWPDVTSNWAGVPEDVDLVFFDTESQSGLAVRLPGYAAAVRSGV